RADVKAFAVVLADARLATGAGADELRRALAPAPVLLLIAPGGALTPSEEGPHALTRPVKPSDLRAALRRLLGQVAEGARADAEVPRAEVPPCRPLHLLVAEDSPVNQKLLLGLLARQGHRTVLAANGREAVEALNREPFDAALLDVQMPEVDGL